MRKTLDDLVQTFTLGFSVAEPCRDPGTPGTPRSVRGRYYVRHSDPPTSWRLNQTRPHHIITRLGSRVCFECWDTYLEYGPKAQNQFVFVLSTPSLVAVYAANPVRTISYVLLAIEEGSSCLLLS